MEEQTGQLIRALAGERTVRVLGVNLTTVALQMCEAHKLSGASAQLASEALASTVLMSGQIKGKERLTLQMRFTDQSASFMGEIDSSHNVRGMMRPARLKWTAGELLNGTVLAIKHNESKELYRGVTNLNHASIEAALMDHLETSNQLDVILRVGCVMGNDGKPSWVGGVVVEKLPDEDTGTLDFEGRFGGIRTKPLRAGVEGLLDGWLHEEEMDVLEIWKVRWRCRCSMERVKSTLLGLGAQSLRELQRDLGCASVTCHFCNVTYRIEGAELEALVEQAASLAD